MGTNKVILITGIIGIILGFMVSRWNPDFLQLNFPKETSDVNSFSDFIETKRELTEMSKWIDSSYDSLIEDAVMGNRVALYVLGLTYLFGNGVPINISAANLYFAKSASLGFAPAINKLRFMYIEDIPNPYLALVYLNMTIAFGHSELIRSYHVLIGQINEKTGSLYISQKIEKIALQKFNEILNNQNKFKESTCKDRFVLNLNDITTPDKDYDSKYWKKIFGSK